MSESSNDEEGEIPPSDKEEGGGQLDTEEHADAFELFQQFKTVTGVVMMDQQGYIVRSNLDDALSAIYCNLSKQMLHTVTSRLAGSGKQTKLRMVRINNCDQELIIYPLEEEKLVLIIVQNPSDHEESTLGLVHRNI